MIWRFNILINRSVKLLASMALIFLLVSSVFAQQNKSAAQNIKEEEIGRYLGYEEIPTRYLSLPYDITMGNNVDGNYMDISYLFALWIPILLIFFQRTWQRRLFTIFLVFVVWLLSVGSSQIMTKDGALLNESKGELTAYIEANATTLPKNELFVMKVYRWANKMYAPIGEQLQKYTDQGDHITYPMLLILYVLLCFLIIPSSSGRKQARALLFLMLSYSMLMLILSAGIVWYGFILLPLFYMVILKGIWRESNLKFLFQITAIISVLASYILLEANKQNLHSKSTALLEQPLVAYQFGKMDDMQLYNAYFPNISKFISKVNSPGDESKILKIGTQFSFFIRNNNKRVIQDDLLGISFSIIKAQKKKLAVNDQLRRAGIKYIVLSLTLPNVDRTPDASLTNKYLTFINYTTDNPYLELVATDRLVRTEVDGLVQNQFTMSEGEVLSAGSYAVFELK